MSMIQQLAPSFTTPAVLATGEISEITLNDYKGKWVVLFFYPLNFTLICPTELTQFRTYLDSFRDTGAEIIGCSVDSVESHKRWIRDDLGNLGYALASDLTKKISKDYDVLIEESGFATRATFIIDPYQRIQYIGIHNPTVGRDAKEILRVLVACQSGKMCPAGWTAGDSHITSIL